MRDRTVQAGDRVVVIGAGRSGQAAVRFLLRRGAQVCLLEKHAEHIPAAFREEIQAAGVEIQCGEHHPGQFVGARFVIPSPAMPIAALRPLLPVSDGPEVLAEMELAWRHLHGERVLAVTGTSGKTTTVSLMAAMLREQGLRVFLGGNIGTPLCEYLLSDARADVVVVEISSFQLQACSTFHPRVGVLLNIAENHLDYHKDMREYIDAKFRLFSQQEEGDLAIFGASLRDLVATYPVRARTCFFEGVERLFPDTRLLGQHNQANLEAAWLACREVGVSREAAERAAAAFAPLPHRLERVLERNGVLYVNDSKCTTIAAMSVALRALDRPVILLCGGRFKGGDVAGLRDLVRERVKAVCGVGASREHFAPVWRDLVPVEWFPDMRGAVKRARELACAGDVVLLAPGTSSFDLYRNYRERGDDFRHVVESDA